MSEQTQHPNVILVCVDEWRGGCLSSAGHPRATPPIWTPSRRHDRHRFRTRRLLHDGFLHVARRRYGTNFALYDDYVPWLRDQPGVTASEEYFDHGAGCNSTVARPWDKAERLHPTAWAGQQPIDWLDRRDPTG